MEADIEECGYVPGVKFKSCRYDTWLFKWWINKK
jgi:hypothetical protein